VDYIVNIAFSDDAPSVGMCCSSLEFKTGIMKSLPFPNSRSRLRPPSVFLPMPFGVMHIFFVGCSIIDRSTAVLNGYNIMKKIIRYRENTGMCQGCVKEFARNENKREMI
jgi:hypothetical protein